MLEVGICVGCWGFCEESATRMFLGPNERTMHRGLGGQTQLFSVTMYVLSTDRTFGTPPSSGRSVGPAPSPTHTRLVGFGKPLDNMRASSATTYSSLMGWFYGLGGFQHTTAVGDRATYF